jgi:hypothetical protein
VSSARTIEGPKVEVKTPSLKHSCAAQCVKHVPLGPKSGVKFAVAVQICPKIGPLLSQFMQQSMNFE